MSNNVVLTDVNGDQILPITTSENVFTGEGVTLKETLDNMAKNGNAGALVVDGELSLESTNPVQNKVIAEKLTELNSGGGLDGYTPVPVVFNANSGTGLTPYWEINSLYYTDMSFEVAIAFGSCIVYRASCTAVGGVLTVTPISGTLPRDFVFTTTLDGFKTYFLSCPQIDLELFDNDDIPVETLELTNFIADILNSSAHRYQVYYK